MKKILSALIIVSLLLSFSSCTAKSGIDLKPDEIKDVVEVTMSVKGYGDIKLELYHDIAPITVENFVSLACSGFYDGTVFHRIIKGFMIQGGDDNGDGIGGSQKTIKGEFIYNNVNNTLSHTRGTISMARTSQSYDSASSQFFIVHEDSTSLDGQYAAFGKVTDGLDVVDAIANVETTYGSDSQKSKPLETVTLKRVIVTSTYDRDGNYGQDDEKLYENTVNVEMSIKGHGKITLELYPDLAPETVKNFISLANEGFYDGTVFHRIIKNFMIQGGDDNGDGIGGSDKTIKGEFSTNGFYNPLLHTRGVISMARTDNPNSASSQFFICHVDYPSLDGKYAAFGRVIEGIEVVDSVASVAVENNSSPIEEVVLEYVKVLD